MAPWWPLAGSGVAVLWTLLALAVLQEVRQDRTERVRLGVEVPREVVRQRPATVALTLTHTGARPLAGTLLLQSGAAISGLPTELPVTLAPGERLRLEWTVTVHRRGPRPLGVVSVRAAGRFNLLERTTSETELGTVSCWPAPGPARALGEPVPSRGWRSGGRGAGEREPGVLTPWEPGMPARDIAWKVLARTGTLQAWGQQRPVSRRVVVAVDLGRRGRAAWGDGTWLDAAIEAALAHAQAAAHQGDEVGLIGFSSVVEQQVRPRRRALELLWAQLGPAASRDSPGDPMCIVRTLEAWGGRGQLVVATPPPLDVAQWRRARARLRGWQWHWLAPDPPELTALARDGTDWERGAASALLAELQSEREETERSAQVGGMPATATQLRPPLPGDPLLT